MRALPRLWQAAIVVVGAACNDATPAAAPAEDGGQHAAPVADAAVEGAAISAARFITAGGGTLRTDRSRLSIVIGAPVPTGSTRSVTTGAILKLGAPR